MLPCPLLIIALPGKDSIESEITFIFSFRTCCPIISAPSNSYFFQRFTALMLSVVIKWKYIATSYRLSHLYHLTIPLLAVSISKTICRPGVICHALTVIVPWNLQLPGVQRFNHNTHSHCNVTLKTDTSFLLWMSQLKLNGDRYAAELPAICELLHWSSGYCGQGDLRDWMIV